MDGLVLERRHPGIFHEGGGEAWMRWRARKLDARAADASALLVELRDPRSMSRAEHAALLERCRRANIAIYASPRNADDPSIPRRLAQQLGLALALPVREESADGIARVPWHTAGHANPAAPPVRATLVHCASAGEGGDLASMDPELAWLRLRDEGEAFVRVLMQPDAFTIADRPREGHAVFAADAAGDLHMRFCESRDAQRWKCDATVSEAAARLRRILDRDPLAVRVRLEPGMGLVTNNVLLTRAMRLDARTRLIHAAFAQRIAGTEGAWRAFLR